MNLLDGSGARCCCRGGFLSSPTARPFSLPEAWWTGTYRRDLGTPGSAVAARCGGGSAGGTATSWGGRFLGCVGGDAAGEDRADTHLRRRAMDWLV